MRYAILLFSFVFSLPVLANQKWGLAVGDRAPNIIQKDIAGQPFNLEESYKKGPVVLVFYRGGWCPYCNIQLRSLQTKLQPELQRQQAKMVAISVDIPDEGSKTTQKNKLTYTVLSDPQAKILNEYKVAFKVPPDLVKKYLGYGIDLERASGESHHTIAIPAVFVVNRTGKIGFAYANEDYKVRAEIADIKAALGSATH